MTNDTGNAQVTFLVVDDDEIFCEVLSRTLQRRGFNVLSALSVDQARQHIARKRPDLAVVDLRIGQDMAERVRDPSNMKTMTHVPNASARATQS